MSERASAIVPSIVDTRILIPIGLGTALSLMGDATLYAVLPTHSADAGIALASVGLVLSVNRLIRLLSNGPAGWLFDRVANPRALFVGSLWLGVLSTAMYALVSGLPLLLASRLLWGLSWSGIWVGGNAIVLQLAPESRRGRWVGIYQTWFFTGSTLGSFLGGVLTDAVGYRNGLWIGAAISAVGAAAALWNPAAGSPPIREGAYHSRGLLGIGWRGLTLELWSSAAAQGINRFVVAGIVSATLGLVVQKQFGAGLEWGSWQIGVASVTGGLLAGRTLVSVLGSPFAGVWADAHGHRWEILAVSLFVGALGIGLLALSNGVGLVAGLILGAAASASIQSIATILVGDLSDARSYGKNIGFFHTFGDFTSAVAPLVAYALLPVVGLESIFLGCSALMVAAGLWSLAIRKRKTRVA